MYSKDGTIKIILKEESESREFNILDEEAIGIPKKLDL